MPGLRLGGRTFAPRLKPATPAQRLRALLPAIACLVVIVGPSLSGTAHTGEGVTVPDSASFTTEVVDLRVSASSTCQGVYHDNVVLPRLQPSALPPTPRQASSRPTAAVTLAGYRAAFTDTATAKVRVVDDLADSQAGGTFAGSVCVKSLSTIDVAWGVSPPSIVGPQLELAAIFWYLTDPNDHTCGDPPVGEQDAPPTPHTPRAILLPSGADVARTGRPPLNHLRPNEYRKVCFTLTVPDYGDLNGPLDASITFMAVNQ